MELCKTCDHAWHGLPCTTTVYDVDSGGGQVVVKHKCGCPSSFELKE